jgi:hypothetical protein
VSNLASSSGLVRLATQILRPTRAIVFPSQVFGSAHAGWGFNHDVASISSTESSYVSLASCGLSWTNDDYDCYRDNSSDVIRPDLYFPG